MFREWLSAEVAGAGEVVDAAVTTRSQRTGGGGDTEDEGVTGAVSGEGEGEPFAGTGEDTIRTAVPIEGGAYPPKCVDGHRYQWQERSADDVLGEKICVVFDVVDV